MPPPDTAHARPLDQLPVTALRGVGPRLAEKLARLQLASVQDLLFHLPLRYQDRTRITPIAALRPGSDGVIEGEVVACDVVYGRRRSLLCRLRDGSGAVSLRFFHFSHAQRQKLAPGARLRCFGEARPGASGLELYHPEYVAVNPQRPAPVAEHLTAIYPTTEGVTQLTLRKLIRQALTYLDSHPPAELLAGLLPPTLRIPLAQALRYLHRPPPDAPQQQLGAGHHPYQRRLAFEELLAHNLSLLRARQQTRARAAPALQGDEGALRARLLRSLGFSLTGAQQRVVAEIDADLARPRPMLRLVQGDVGSGKTVVAAVAALRAAERGYQVAVMAPTEILAEQHLSSFQRWLAPLGIEVGQLLGKTKGAIRRQQLAAIASAEAQVVVGTHALFQADVNYARLALVIIDEQHRFGVHQRLALKEKADPALGQPHQLIMTATPIPRTLAMSAYADLDTSVIDELPPGRQPVHTALVDNSRRADVVARIQRACAEGQQAYWVCTAIEESEQLQAQAAEALWEDLREALPQLRIGLIHGRLKPAQKETAMQAMATRELDLLVATTVIEVGVDVPNATIMVIENSERLGLAQLHQLRGRVGRGGAASYCVLLYQSPLSHTARERLQALRDSNDGFVIAEKDLALRGPGEMLGTRQTGLLQLRIADLQRDSDLLAQVRDSATQLLRGDSGAVDALVRRWLGGGERYAGV